MTYQVASDGVIFYASGMTSQHLTTQAMALPLSERVSLAQALWQSIDTGLPEISEGDAVREAIRRDEELSAGIVSGRTHVEVMPGCPVRHRMRLTYHPEAEAELIAAAYYYQRQVPGLGVEFIEAADRAISLVQDAPERWTIIEADVRRYLMPRFPYAIYYRRLPAEIRILAYKHHSRHPDYWRDRLMD